MNENSSKLFIRRIQYFNGDLALSQKKKKNGDLEENDSWKSMKWFWVFWQP